jgi:hypothetical protein
MFYLRTSALAITVVVASASLLFGCSGDAKPDTSGAGGSGSVSGSGGSGSVSGSGGSSSVSGSGGSGGSGGAGGSGGSEVFEAEQCMKAGGLCDVKGACTGGGKTVVSDANDCHFDDATAECCKPPAPKPNAETCADRGGLCASISGCFQAGGHLTPTTSDCKAVPSYACCVPFDYCGPENIDCCSGQTVFRPACDNGTLKCTVGEPKPKGTCP